MSKKTNPNKQDSSPNQTSSNQEVDPTLASTELIRLDEDCEPATTDAPLDTLELTDDDRSDALDETDPTGPCETSDSSLNASFPISWIVAIIVIAILGFGAFGYFAGAGPFFYRKILYGNGELYALNLSPQPLWVEVDQSPPFKVSPNDATIVSLLGGTSSIKIRETEDGPVKQQLSVTTDHSDVLVKLSDDGCLIAVDLDPYYGGKSQDIKFTDRVTQNDRVWNPHSRNVVWPRKAFPPKLKRENGPGRWIELVACSLLEDTDDDRKFLEAYIALRLEERMAKAKGTPAKPSL